MTTPSETLSADQQEMLASLEASLRDQREIDASEREAMLAQAADALRTQAASNTRPEDLMRNLGEALDMLESNRMIDPSEREALVARFDAALEPLRDPAIRRLLDGESAAEAPQEPASHPPLHVVRQVPGLR